MKRLFVNQSGDSNKFWSIDQSGNSYTVTWGKVGTDGRTNDKTFSSPDECTREVDKLVKEKLGKGYHEVSDEVSILKKPVQAYRPMDEDLFWEVISLFDWKKLGDDDAVIRPAVKRLAGMTIEDIYEFEDIMSEKLYQLDGITYASNIGEDSYKGDDQHFSVDYFLYVRCCVVANGRDVFNYILSHPEEMPKGMDFEALLNVAMEAYNKKTRTDDYFHVTKFNYETFSNIEGWRVK
ncbi:MAG: DUF4240 domain-containing protein [Chryseolinea sp.]